MRSWEFAKGHGTLNDFVLLRDRHGMMDLDAATVRFLCDRRAGVGGDGLLRAIKAEHVPEWDGDPDVWFMDYRNADGSVAEMCGNGARVFARYLWEGGLASTPFDFGTRAGLRRAERVSGGLVRVSMGPTTVGAPATATVAGVTYAGTRVDVGNPHLVCEVDPAALPALDLSQPPTLDPAEAFPASANVEFFHRGPGDALTMRVHERGSGETLSCGTGTVAVAAAANNGEGSVRVHVPGGELQVDFSDGDAFLTGGATIVATGTVQVPGKASYQLD